MLSAKFTQVYRHVVFISYILERVSTPVARNASFMMPQNNNLIHDSSSLNVATKIKLNSGHYMDLIGLGTWKSKPGEVAQAVKDAIDSQYRHFDCAFKYENEAEVGAGIQSKLKEGVVQRSDLFITSKLWNTFHKPDLVEPALKTSLQDLQLEYLDLYLIHFPTSFKEGGDHYPKDAQGQVLFSDVNLCDTWKAMEQLVDKGLVKSIGVSNFNSEQINRIMNCARIPPAVNQIELHPYLSQYKLVDFCQSKGIAVTAYSPLRSQDRDSPHEPSLLEDETLKRLASKHNKSVAQIILRWILQRGVSVIPKSVNKKRIQENINLYDFQLTDEDMDAVNNLNKNSRANLLLQAKNHKEYPFHIEF